MKRVLALMVLTTLTNMVMAQTDTNTVEGKLNRNRLEEFNWFPKNYNDYKPALSVIEQLIPYKKCSVVVVLGTWCSDSHELVPQLFKVMDMAGWEKVELIGVNRKKKCSTVDITPLNIEYVPVIMLFNNGKYIGRITETAEKSIEEDLLKLLQ